MDPEGFTKLKTRTNAGTATFRPRGLCGRRCLRQRPHCSVELKRRVAERGRRSRSGHTVCALCDAPFKYAQQVHPVRVDGSHFLGHKAQWVRFEPGTFLCADTTNMCRCERACVYVWSIQVSRWTGGRWELFSTSF